MTATITSLSSRYTRINNDLAKMTATLSGPEGQAAMSRLILRAAVLNARIHNPDEVVAKALRSTSLELGGGE